MKIILAIPSRYGIQNETVGMLLELKALLTQRGIEAPHYITSSPYIDHNRFASFEFAVKQNADYVLFIDNDVFLLSSAEEAIDSLIGLDKDVAVGIYQLRVWPFYPLIFNIAEPGKPCFRPVEFPPYPMRFDAAATGFMLIKRKVIDAFTVDYMREHGAPFQPLLIENHEGKIEPMGEDLSFCWRLRDFGFEVWADPSITLSHIGQKKIIREDWEREKVHCNKVKGVTGG